MSKLKMKTSSVNTWRSLCWWPDLSDCLITSFISQGGHRKNPPTITAETMARHDEKTSAGRAKMLSGGDTGDRLTEVDEVLGWGTTMVGSVSYAQNWAVLTDTYTAFWIHCLSVSMNLGHFLLLDVI